MRKCVLKLAYSAWPPYTIDMDNKERSGLEGQLIYLMADRFNLQFQMKKYPYSDGNTLEGIGTLNTTVRLERHLKLYVIIKFSCH